MAEQDEHRPLDQQVDQVAGGQELRVLDLEDDRRSAIRPIDDRQHAALAAPHPRAPDARVVAAGVGHAPRATPPASAATDVGGRGVSGLPDGLPPGSIRVAGWPGPARRLGVGVIGQPSVPLVCRTPARRSAAGRCDLAAGRPVVIRSTTDLAVEVGRRAGGHHAAEVQHREAVGHLEDVVQVVRDHAARPSPRSARRRTRLEHHGSVWATPRAAVGSSMITSLDVPASPPWPPPPPGAGRRTARPTGWRTERTVVTDRPASVSCAVSLHRRSSSSRPCRSRSRPEEHVLDDVEVVAQGQVLVHGLDARARSASRGPCRWTGWPFQRISPPSGSRMPAMLLISIDLPAPLSPDQRGDLAGRDVEVDAGQGLHRAEVLVDARAARSSGGRLRPRTPCRAARPAGARPADAGRAPVSALAVTAERSDAAARRVGSALEIPCCLAGSR